MDKRAEPWFIDSNLASFGVDGRGELYAVGQSAGAIFKLAG